MHENAPGRRSSNDVPDMSGTEDFQSSEVLARYVEQRLGDFQELLQDMRWASDWGKIRGAIEDIDRNLDHLRRALDMQDAGAVRRAATMLESKFARRVGAINHLATIDDKLRFKWAR